MEGVAADSQKRESPGVTHQVTHRNREANFKLPFRSGYRRRDAALRYPLGLSADVRGVDQKWVLLKSGE
jgi:hypothetical protein